MINRLKQRVQHNRKYHSKLLLSSFHLNVRPHLSDLKGHLQPVCSAVVHFTEIICCNTEISFVICVFDNSIVSTFLVRRVSQPAIPLGCEDTIRFSNTIRTLVISVLQQMTLVKCTATMHTD